jgi:outer membrane protein TolC
MSRSLLRQGRGPARRTLWRPLVPCLAAALLTACATPDFNATLRAAQADSATATSGPLTLATTADERAAQRQQAEALLAQPLSADDALRLALANSASLQALLAQARVDEAQSVAAGRLAGPVFSFERMRQGDEREFGRLLSFGLLDLISWPQRQALAQSRSAQVRLELAGAVVDLAAEVRRTWVRAVAAEQTLQYAGQVREAAEASAELARRMQQVGNFTRLQRARQHAFYADAAAQQASAAQAATAAREQLVRVLGLDDAQAARLRLPERLPDLPSAPRAPADVRDAALAQRLDLRLARQQLEAAGRSRQLGRPATFADVELGLRHDTVFDDATGQRANRNGVELDIRLPLWGGGSAQREALDAATLAAGARYDAVARAATSRLREDYAAYRSALALAQHWRDEIVPLRQVVADENLLRYNGMLIGVFELLADTREQIAAVTGAIRAQEQFWLADAALSASVLGRPQTGGSPPAGMAGTAAAGNASGDGGH